MKRHVKGAFISLALTALVVAPFGISLVRAQSTRSYDYASIKTVYTVNRDSTITVEETQTYEFTGAYHQAERIIPHKGSGAITDIVVIDATTGKPLTRAAATLDKNNSSSWDRYVVSDKNGSVHVDWYYNLADTTHAWILRYTLHGAVSFYKDHDEIYWNIFSGYDVPVKFAEAVVILPAVDSLPTATWYVNGEHNTTITRPDGRTFDFTAQNFTPREAATFAVGWQKGLVDHSAYWRDWLTLNWPYVASLLVILFSILFSVGYWYTKEYLPRKKRVIIAEYEPPLHLPPALAAMVLTEMLPSRAWSATIVDLAVRGYLTIAEMPRTGLARLSFRTDYQITKREPSAGESALRPYEKSLLDILFENGPTFSTEELRKSPSRQRAMSVALLIAQSKMRDDADSLGLYARGLKDQATGLAILAPVIALILVGGAWLLNTSIAQFIPFSYVVLIGAIVVAAGIIFYRVRFSALLNDEGQKVRADLLGFKLYLQTAERYRVQNLTPETFEKYLPYAMIFGVEKKWAKAFDGMTISPPSWYGGTTGAYIAGNAANSFSPTSFASGFSTSFASSFAGSGGSGMSGGGGGAGGGGGGGGGGAS